MKIKEFSQKYSEAFFYATIILFIVSVALAISLSSINKKTSNFKNNFGGGRNGTMQNGDDFRQNKKFNRTGNSVDTQSTDTNTQDTMPSDTTTTETLPVQ